ncbi:MAG: HisA/HisF-related TIM barrel protein [Methylococcaceae bacterium]
MKIIPVIDLKAGVVVHAKHGQREQYLAISSKLSHSAELLYVLAAFLKLYPFDTFYIADLDAIMGLGNNTAILKDLFIKYPNISFWVDAGKQTSLQAISPVGNFIPVIGSECFSNEELPAFDALKQNFILSLDFAKTTQLGAFKLFTDTKRWPQNIIIMTLDRVGSQMGPDLEKLSVFQQSNPGKNFIAAGGVRHYQDLVQLKKIGINQALIASALHSGQLDAKAIHSLQTKKYPD